MIANLGREDELLNATRFDRLLRQAHDAELVEVRKVGEDMYDVSPLGQSNAPPARYERKQQPASRPVDEPVQPAAPAAVDVPPPPAAPRSLGPRRGTRSGMIKASIPLVGVISLDETPVKVAATEEKAPPRGRGKPGAQASAPAKPEDEAAAPKKGRPRRRGGRGKPKPAS
jgi:hypothetical protein